MKKSNKIDINNERIRTRTNSGSMSSFQFVPVRCLYGAVFHTRSAKNAKLSNIIFANFASFAVSFSSCYPNGSMDDNLSIDVYEDARKIIDQMTPEKIETEAPMNADL